MSAALPAFLLEAIFYLGAMFPQTREWFGRISSQKEQGALLWVSAVAPYLVFSLAAGNEERSGFYLLAALCALLSFWYVLVPRRAAYDFGFLIIAAAPIVERVFPRIYRSPASELRIDVLGHLMWIRLGIFALLVLREWDPGPFSPWPTRTEWKIGLLYYLAVLVPLVLVALGIHELRFTVPQDAWWKVAAVAVGTFFAALWIIALGEELFFRGVVERALYDQWRSPALAVLLSALIFGAAHLWFHQFPDWRRAVVAAILGIGCGMAYLQTGTARASMVTHAFVVATWRVFFR
jgi:uncharacterized protein